MKTFEKDNLTIALNVLYLKKVNIYPAYISKHNLNHKIKSFFIDSKWREMALSCSKETISIIKRNSFKTKLIFIFSIVSTLLEQKTNLNLVKIYVKMKVLAALQCLLNTLRYWSLIITKNLIRYHLLFKQILNL